MSAAATPAADGHDDELEDFVHSWAEAIVANDVARMERLVADDDWVLIDRPGLVTREQFHAVVASGELRHDTMSHEVITVRRLAPEVAVLVTRGRNTGSYRGRPINADEWTTDVIGPDPRRLALHAHSTDTAGPVTTHRRLRKFTRPHGIALPAG